MSNIFQELDNHTYRQYDYIKFGIKTLDEQVLGIKKGTYGVLAGQSGVGKSLFSGWFFRSFMGQGNKVGFFNMELSTEEVFNRLKSFPTLPHKTERAAESKVITGVKSMMDIENYIQQEKPDVVIIDWLGLIDIRGKEKYSSQREIAHKLKQLAERYNVAILLINQVNKLSVANNGAVSWYGANAGVAEIYDLCALYIGIYDRINAKAGKIHAPDVLKGIMELHVDKARFLGQYKGIAYTRRHHSHGTTFIDSLSVEEQLQYMEIMEI